MAEMAQPPQRFYCHKCNVEIDNVSSEFTCPLCGGGFIEELPPNSSTDRGQSTSSSGDDVEMSGEYDNHRLNDRISSLLMSSIGGSLRSFDDDNGDPSSNQDGSTSSGQRSRRHRRRNTDVPNFENIMQEFLISISQGPSQTPNQMFFMGNPGDYAWGREGLDSVITQMLNQMENSGPPPLSKEKIKDIPSIEITDEHVDQKLQCSVCWEVYERMEMARKLPCTHIFHDNCIIPWLELHGTCPVCRKPVEEDSQNPLTNRLGNVYRTTFNFFNDSDTQNHSDVPENNLLSFLSSQLSQQTQSDQASSTQSDQSPPSQSQQQQQQPQQQRTNSESSNNSTSRRDDDGNVEFDCD